WTGDPHDTDVPLTSRPRQGERLAQGFDPLRDEAIEHPRAAPFAGEESCLGQHLQMMADGRLRETERLDEVADARLGARLTRDEAQQAEPPRVGDRLERRRERLGIVAPETRPEDRSTAARCLHRHPWILT